MASKRRLRRVRCGSKRRFTDQQSAAHAAMLIRKSGGDQMRPYHCNFCGGFHIGHYAGGHINGWYGRSTPKE